jgi:hypothetical protein
MATVVIYVDEAGNPDSHQEPLVSGETPLITLAGVALPLSDWRRRDRAFLRLKKQFFPDMMGRPGKRDEEVEIKGRDLTSPHQRTSSRRQEFNRQALKFVDQCGGKALAATFLKSSSNPMSGHSLYTKALQILVERISLFVAESTAYDQAILICDSRMKGVVGLDIEVARSHMSYIFGHATGRTFTNIVEAPLFADSRLTVGLQLADIVAANLYSCHYDYYLRGTAGALNYAHAHAYWPLLDSIQFKAVGQVGGFPIFGYRVVDQRTGKASDGAP